MASRQFNESDCNGEESWKFALNKSRDYICNHISDTLEVLNKVQSHSTSDVSRAARQRILGRPTEYKQNDQFVEWLVTRNEATFNIFLQALRDTGNSFIVKEILRNNTSKSLALENRRSIFPFEEDSKSVSHSNDEEEKCRRELISIHESMRLRIDEEQSHKSHKKGFIVVTGGIGPRPIGILRNSHVYNIELNRWDGDFQIPNTPVGMFLHSLVNLDGLLCTVGGYDEEKNAIIEPQIFSASEKSWISSPAMPDILIVEAVYKQPGIIAMGFSADSNFKIVQMGLNFAWKDIVELEGTPWCNCVSLNEKIYCFNGQSSDGYKVYDPANKSWSNISRSTKSKITENFKVVAIQGCIVLIGTDKRGTCEIYNPDNNTIYYLTSMPEPVEIPAVATDGKSIFVIGGKNEDRMSDTLQIYDYEDEKWRKGAPCPLKLSFAAAAFVHAE